MNFKFVGDHCWEQREEEFFWVSSFTQTPTTVETQQCWTHEGKETLGYINKNIKQVKWNNFKCFDAVEEMYIVVKCFLYASFILLSPRIPPDMMINNFCALFGIVYKSNNLIVPEKKNRKNVLLFDNHRRSSFKRKIDFSTLVLVSKCLRLLVMFISNLAIDSCINKIKNNSVLISTIYVMLDFNLVGVSSIWQQLTFDSYRSLFNLIFQTTFCQSCFCIKIESFVT